MNSLTKSLLFTMYAILAMVHVEAAVVTIDPGGNGTIDAIFSPDGTYIYTGRNIDGKVTAIRTSDYSVAAEVSVGYNPLGLCTAGNGAYLYVSNTVNGSYTTKIDTKTFQVSANIPGGTDPAYMALTPDGSTLLITSHWSPFLQLVSVETDQEIGRVYGIANGGFDVAVTPDGQYAYVLARSDGPNPGTGLFKVSLSTLTIVSTIPVTGGDGIAITPDGSEVWVPGYNHSDVVYVIDATTNTIKRVIPAGRWPIDVAISPNSDYAYVTLRDDNALLKIDLATYSVVGSVTVGESPAFVNLSPDGSQIVVANQGSNNLTLLTPDDFGPPSWCDDFEDYSSNSGWSANWHGSGNVSGITIDETTVHSGSKALRMFGLLGGCWGAIVTHPIQISQPLTVAFAVRNGTESLSGCHPYRAVFGISTGGPDWFDCPCHTLVYFLPNGDISMPLAEDGASVFPGYGLDSWLEMKCEMSLPGDGLLHVKVWANSTYLREYTVPEEPWMSQPAYVDFGSDEGTVWYDDICITSGSTSLPVAFDFKPGSCPNPLNLTPFEADDQGSVTMAAGNVPSVNHTPAGGPKKAVVPAAILGTADFDVTQINPETIRLMGVAPVRWSIEDVATPADKTSDACACNDYGADGYDDLTLKFYRADLISAMDDVADGDVVTLTVSGELNDGTPFEGTDCVVIIDNSKPSGIADNPDDGVEKVVTTSNYPNPFNPSTVISFSLPSAGRVTLDIYNVNGQRVDQLIDGFRDAGDYTVTWDASRYASGVYFYRLTAGDYVQTRRMVLLK